MGNLNFQELGVAAGTPAGTSLIDVHAGGVGVIESVSVSNSIQKENDKEDICHRMVLVCGTSTCHMAVSQNKVFIPGVWGPFWPAMLPEYWLTEGGQSATGALLDYILNNHVATPHLANRAASQSISTFELLDKMLESMMNESKAPFLAILMEDLHSLPNFHGNRSPMADPVSKGVICGLTPYLSEKKLALYTSPQFRVLHMEPGRLWSITIPMGTKESESVLLGAAILGAVSAKKYSGLRDAQGLQIQISRNTQKYSKTLSILAVKHLRPFFMVFFVHWLSLPMIWLCNSNNEVIKFEHIVLNESNMI
ncbi:hypothetical protein GIB67_015663 [Kingdonia uniflora]|uniref:Carbohydrate kinase FGGY C-terminal domain-containing protein n=1 Tax=Kingdonia uniflora TaxID=39325 RepID=A0A7J7NU62_9MAGN|nr:hypothetical protein GIB67_015663 [Kingdonia uniflora]